MWSSKTLHVDKIGCNEFALPYNIGEIIVDLTDIESIQLLLDSRYSLPYNKPADLIRFCEMAGDKANFSVTNNGLHFDFSGTPNVRTSIEFQVVPGKPLKLAYRFDKISRTIF